MLSVKVILSDAVTGQLRAGPIVAEWLAVTAAEKLISAARMRFLRLIAPPTTDRLHRNPVFFVQYRKKSRLLPALYNAHTSKYNTEPNKC